MRRVIRTSLTVAVATVMICLAVSQARADRVGYAVDRCFGADCIGGNVRIGELSLAFTESILGVVDSSSSATTLGSFTPDLGRRSELRSAGSSVKTTSDDDVEVASTVKKDKENNAVMFIPGLGFGFRGLEVSATSLSIDLGRSVTANTRSFSVGGAAALNANLRAVPFGSSDANMSRGTDQPEVAPGGAPVPEPTTMLLLGTGLVGAAAIVRRRLRNSRR